MVAAMKTPSTSGSAQPRFFAKPEAANAAAIGKANNTPMPTLTGYSGGFGLMSGTKSAMRAKAGNASATFR